MFAALYFDCHDYHLHLHAQPTPQPPSANKQLEGSYKTQHVCSTSIINLQQGLNRVVHRRTVLILDCSKDTDEHQPYDRDEQKVSRELAQPVELFIVPQVLLKLRHRGVCHLHFLCGIKQAC